MGQEMHTCDLDVTGQEQVALVGQAHDGYIVTHAPHHVGLVGG